MDKTQFPAGVLNVAENRTKQILYSLGGRGGDITIREMLTNAYLQGVWDGWQSKERGAEKEAGICHVCKKPLSEHPPGPACYPKSKIKEKF